jgi:hypothetical protein
MDGGRLSLKDRRLLLLVAGGAVFAAASVAVMVSRGTPAVSAGVAAAMAAILLSLGYLALQFNPAIPFALAVVLSPFADNWPRLGIPGSLSPDRLVVVLAIVVTLIQMARSGAGAPRRARCPRRLPGPHRSLRDRRAEGPGISLLHQRPRIRDPLRPRAGAVCRSRDERHGALCLRRRFRDRCGRLEAEIQPDPRGLGRGAVHARVPVDAAAFGLAGRRRRDAARTGLHARTAPLHPAGGRSHW